MSMRCARFLAITVALLLTACSSNNNAKPATAAPTQTKGATLAATVAPTRTPTVAVTSAAPAATAVAPTVRAQTADSTPCLVGQIKGNRSSKIYHVPSGRDYAKTTADVECFDTEQQAVAAGYRKAAQ